jgi:hypothetical protein
MKAKKFTEMGKLLKAERNEMNMSQEVTAVKAETTSLTVRSNEDEIIKSTKLLKQHPEALGYKVYVTLEKNGKRENFKL